MVASVAVVAIVLAGFAGNCTIHRGAPDGAPANYLWAGYPIYETHGNDLERDDPGSPSSPIPHPTVVAGGYS